MHEVRSDWVTFMTLKKLETLLARATSSEEYFHAIFDFVKLNPKYAIEWENGKARRVIFFSEGFNQRLAEVILSCPGSAEYFRPVRELRIVATRMDIILARRLKALNPSMQVFWMSGDEWRSRPAGGKNPVILTDPPGGIEI